MINNTKHKLGWSNFYALSNRRIYLYIFTTHHYVNVDFLDAYIYIVLIRIESESSMLWNHISRI